MAGIVTANYVLNQPDPPPAPDYAGAAEATAAGNRVNQYTPWGSSVWTAPTEGDTWSQTITLSPEQRRLMNLNNQTDIKMAKLGLMGLNATSDLFSTPYSSGMSDITDYGGERDRITQNMLARVNTDIQREKEDLHSQLVAQGVPPGSPAYQREMEYIDRKQTDARQQAELASTEQIGQLQNQEIQRRRQRISEILQERQTPLNELNAFRTGTQVGMPQFPDTPAGPDYLTAAGLQSQYDLAGWNADIAQRNAILGGLFGMGAAFAGRPS